MQIHFLTAFALPICKRNDKHESIFPKGKQEDIIKWIMTGMPFIDSAEIVTLFLQDDYLHLIKHY